MTMAMPPYPIVRLDMYVGAAFAFGDDRKGTHLANRSQERLRVDQSRDPSHLWNL